MAIPRPGKPVRGSQSGAPIMAAFDLLGRRWAMGIIWNLSSGPATFRGLQAACETISPSILNRRLKDLREARLVERTLDGYQLTESGSALFRHLHPLGDWAIGWARLVADEEE
ncbi:MAG: helix-turn-helix transcriptional regulator [Desulfobulbaceae bacterium]|uniref:Transcriptional regulator, HxlR family n=2 Tax=Desulfofustis glycolicus TaxID=51195 RepID=A0A1M5XYP4_9BACT|nr:helix-turn-helix transcriptional regulator [Desulfobulbaceae bacterium]SHI04941.1 transcriptional regulator, HxlR family [Desulfofustis glycolicus DSM 9705]